MGTDSIIIICVVIIAALIAIFRKPSKDLTVTIKMEDEPIKDDRVETLEVKPKRAYNKRAPKTNVAKRPVGRPKKIK